MYVPRPTPKRISSDPLRLQLADWHRFRGSIGVKLTCKQQSQIAGWMRTMARNGQVVTDVPYLVRNAGGGRGMGGTGAGRAGDTGDTGSNPSARIINANAATSTRTIPAHSRALIPYARGTPHPAAPRVSRKRRLEEYVEEEGDNDRHRTQRRKFTHSHEVASDSYDGGCESRHHGRYYRSRLIPPMYSDPHRDMPHAVPQAAFRSGH